MNTTGKRAGLTLLAAAYLLSAFLVFRHVARDAGPGRVTIRVCQWQLETGLREAVDALIRRYEELNPRVHVVQIALPGGPVYTSWILTQMAGGTGPDLAQYAWNNPHVAEIFQPISADITAPNPYNRGTPLEGVPWKDTFVDGMACNFDHNLRDYYSASLSTHVARIVYNRSLLEAVTGSDAPPRTYRGLLALAGQVRAYAKARGLTLVPLANSSDIGQLQSWLIAMNMAGGLCERIDSQHRLAAGPGDLGRYYLRNDWSYDSPEAVASLQALREYGDLCTPGFWARMGASAVSDFVTGRALMIVCPSWEAPNLLGLCPFGIAAFPYPYPRQDDPVYGRYARGPFSDGQVTTGLSLYVSRATAHRAEAIDFLRFITSQEGDRIFSRVSNWPPSTIGVRPSAFASQFKLQSEGYYWGGNLLVPTLELDAENFISTHMADLWGAGGGVDVFRKVMREGLASRIRDDLRHETASALDDLRQGDTRAAARVELGGPGGFDTVPVMPVVNEASMVYQARALVDPSTCGAPDPPASAVAAPAARVDSGPQGPGTGPCARLIPAWRALAAFDAGRALGIFDRSLDAADPKEAREARFGRAVSLLGRQPVSQAHVEEARGLLDSLAGSGTDDPAQGARFFLGRIAQHHQETPDPAEAARQYRRLLSDHPASVWAQSALARLALLDLYALNPGEAPAERVARAEGLLALATAPAARDDLHIAIAYAVFFYRLPGAAALPHLLAAERLGRLDWLLRTDVLVQIAELSRLAGERAQAARYYRAFLGENPIDARRYIVRERLAAVEGRPFVSH
jgi:ABC-type glycerol-3-phosphate transport system substrate-binding protein